MRVVLFVGLSGMVRDDKSLEYPKKIGNN